MTQDYDLDEAYKIAGPEDAKKLYGDWATTYDDSFGAGWGYVAPQRIAEIYRAQMSGEEVPILDIGAGTGLIAEHLAGLSADAFDITPEMLAVAKGKALYRQTILGDLTQPLALEDASYGGVVSCGTFTHGHVGPECLPELLRVTRAGALFVCGTIATVFDQMRFGSTLAGLVADGRITPMHVRKIAIYEGGDHPHVSDEGLVMVFRKL
ncbi:class I SAM-dependent DNA methyltransferase [Thalassococcus sp. BH17M4-6]|uniref:class I SAM-dependent DNA methyltransferase n=1 Tax=Thalassococcus sp. BH17M4-6 TaxID=3413148 RepID=UPI003BE172AA